MITRLSALVAAALFAVALPATAQSTSVLSVSPIPDGAEERFCYYNGLAFSSQSLLTVEVPFRREGPASVQKRLMRCSEAEDGAMFWLEIDLERGINQ